MGAPESSLVGLGLPSAPTYRPTAEQFKHPLEFIASIRAEAERYGICKIVPPPEWKPPFMLDVEAFTFKTRIQSVSELQQKVSESAEFKEWNAKYVKWLKAAGRERKRNPMLSGREINLFKFHRVVRSLGGFQACCDAKGWREVARLLGVTSGSTNLPYAIRTMYVKAFEDFDRWLAAGETSVSAAPVVAEQSASVVPVSPKPGLDRPPGDPVSAVPKTPDHGKVKAVASKKRKASTPGSTPRKKKKPDKALPVAGPNGSARIPGNIDVLVCEVCDAGHHEDKIILCDRCDKGFHLFCLSPPLDDVPEGDWICPFCVEHDNDASFFLDGPLMTIAEMQDASNAFARAWWGEERASKGEFTKEELEFEFWRIVEGGKEQVEVFYGADLDTGKVGSGFPRRGESENPYATHPWNVNNFPKNDGVHSSMLKHVTEPIKGVIVPWLYIGHMFSSFCWHVEDHMFYSINYNHWGAPKQW